MADSKSPPPPTEPRPDSAVPTEPIEEADTVPDPVPEEITEAVSSSIERAIEHESLRRSTEDPAKPKK